MLNYLRTTQSVLLSVCFVVMASAHGAVNNRALLPSPVTNNAVTQVEVDGEQYLLSFSGLGANKGYRDVHNKAYRYQVNRNEWREISPVPLSQGNRVLTKNLTGRLASVATSIKDKAYVFGGYTVAKDHSEVSISDVYAYDVKRDSYQRLAPMPVPVDDSVALSFQNKYIYLVSGWHNSGNVNLVQLYNVETNQWQQATPYPGKAVFGHAGGIVGNKMLVCDGVAIKVHKERRRSYQDEAACYLGIINEKNPMRIDWRVVKHPTKNARYRMAAVGLKARHEIVFIGGSDNPYNYNGIGYDGKPSQPSNAIWRYNLATNQWQIFHSKVATMDHRGLLVSQGELITLGGMAKKQKVLKGITVHSPMRID